MWCLSLHWCIAIEVTALYVKHNKCSGLKSQQHFLDIFVSWRYCAPPQMSQLCWDAKQQSANLFLSREFPFVVKTLLRTSFIPTTHFTNKKAWVVWSRGGTAVPPYKFGVDLVSPFGVDLPTYLPTYQIWESRCTLWQQGASVLSNCVYYS